MHHLIPIQKKYHGNPRDPQRHECIDHWQLLSVFELHQSLGEIQCHYQTGNPRTGYVNMGRSWN
jgi:hypothetical protein